MAIAMTSRYSEQTEGALRCIEAAEDWAKFCVDRLPRKDHHIFIDYGAADGGTAVNFWKSILKNAIQKHKESHFSLIGNDLPTNNNLELLNSLNKQTEENSKLTTFISARSFYEQIYAKNSVSFGFSATAMHWLNKPITSLKNHTHVQASHDKKCFGEFQAQAIDDWDKILGTRSQELCKGGKLLTLNLSRDSNNNYLGNNGGKTLNILNELHKIWKDIYEEDLINKSEYEDATIQNFYKSPEEFIYPLKNEDSVAYKNGLRLIDQRTVYIECPYKKKWLIDKDSKSFSNGLMETIRSWSKHSFSSSIKQKRDYDPVEILFNRLRQKIKDSPTDWSLDYVEHHLLAEKI